jgi:hypothetical protein
MVGLVLVFVCVFGFVISAVTTTRWVTETVSDVVKHGTTLLTKRAIHFRSRRRTPCCIS